VNQAFVKVGWGGVGWVDWEEVKRISAFFLLCIPPLLSIPIEGNGEGNRIPNSTTSPCPIGQITKHMGPHIRWTLTMIKINNSVSLV
jgi:hypothetical protein